MKYWWSFLVVLLVSMLLPAYVFGGDVYVATNGSDSDKGKIDSPFATIQHAADTAGAGDTVYIRGGKYHQRIILNELKGTSSEPITFTAYNGEEVIIAGTTPITNTWSVHSGSIWKTTLSVDTWQLFVDGNMMTAARWPNVEKDWDEPDDSSGFDPTPGSYWDMDGTQGRLADESSWGHFYNDERYNSLAALGKSVEGAMLVGYRCLVSGNDVFTEQITSHAAGESDFTHTTVTFAADTSESQAASGARYYIEGDLDLLDVPGEWFYDKDTKELYVWFADSGSPAGRYIEGKTEHFILDLTNCEYLNFSGIELFGGAFDLSETYDTTFTDCRFIYPSYGRRMLKVIKSGVGYVIHDFAAAYNRTGGSRNPANVVWQNCEFANFEGCGLYIRTNGGNLVENCYFHNGQILQVIYGAVSDHKGSETILRRNTLHTLGLNNATKNGSYGLLEYNHIYNMHFDGDFSACQVSTGSQEGTLHRYNWIHDCKGRNGIRFDGDPAGIRGQAHHVVSMRNMRGFRLKGDQHKIYNLTGLDNTPKSDINIAFEKFYGYDPPECMEYECRILGSRGDEPYHGNENSIVRNIAGNVIDNWPLVALDNAAVWHGMIIGKELEDQLRDPANFDFRPRADSDLIDAGVEVAGVTDGYIGAAPDIGAYEANDVNYWIPGRRLKKATTPVPPNGAVGVKVDADLMWLGGLDAVSHKVYFGTDPNNLPLVSTQANNIYDPGGLDEDKVYYWRVDTVTPTETVTGDEWSFALVVPEVPTETAVFYPIEDSYVDCNFPDTNYGSLTTLELRTPIITLTVREAYVKFDVQTGGEIVKATLRLYSANVLSAGVNVYEVDDNSWGEYKVTWNNRPAMGVLPFGFLAPSYGWDECDVTGYFAGDGIRSIGLVRGPRDSNRRAQSRESLYSPELIIEYILSAPQNHAPYFQSGSFASSDGVEGRAYNGDISSEATDPDGDVLVFSKAAGPAWLIVNPDGTLEGVPGTDDVGVNTFTMRIEDGSGLYDEGSMTIKVNGSPDVNGDGIVNLEDVAVMAKYWQGECAGPDWCDGADIDLGGRVDIVDLLILAQSWLD